MIWLVLRVVLFVAAVAAFAGLAGVLVDTDGAVAITWGGYEYPPLRLVEFIALVLVVSAALFAIYKLTGLVVALVRFALGDETALTRYWARAKERRGIEAVSRGLVALAEGEAETAANFARKATRLLGERDLTRLLRAQIAEAQGDVADARRHYRELAKEPSTAIVGVKGLLAQAVKQGETDRALKFAEHAFAIRPKDAGVQQTLFDLQVRRGDWEGALRTLSALAKGKSLPKDVTDRRQAVINLERARDARAAGDTRRAVEAADSAVKAAPGLAPAAAFAARLHMAEGDVSRAGRMIKEAWKQAPHPDLAQAFAELAPNETPAARRRRFRDLVAANPEHEETRFMLAELAIADADWQGARKALGDLPSEKPTHRSLALMAAIEKGQGGSEAVVRGYLARAVSAPRGAHWVCDRCAASPGGWSAVCPSCGGFDTLAWRETAEASEAVSASMLPLMVESDDEEDRLDAE
ncbi:MAG: heme biosynthesis protein HemY, partial [Rubrimonas sp.]